MEMVSQTISGTLSVCVCVGVEGDSSCHEAEEGGYGGSLAALQLHRYSTAGPRLTGALYHWTPDECERE